MTKIKLLFLSLGLFMLLLFTNVPIMNAQTSQITNSSKSLTITITDAYYTSLSEDMVEDDVVVHFEILIEKDSEGRTHFEIDFDLTLPSGRIVSYSYIINTVNNQLIGIMEFHNDALEYGMYNIQIDIALLSGGVTTGTASYDFDPPGSTEGGDPHGSLYLS